MLALIGMTAATACTFPDVAYFASEDGGLDGRPDAPALTDEGAADASPVAMHDATDGPNEGGPWTGRGEDGASCVATFQISGIPVCK